MKKIKLTQGKSTLVDDEDYEWISKLKWRYASNGSAVRNSSRHLGAQKVLQLHRIIMNAPDGLVVDHINGDRLDNRKQNLRVCSQSQNSMNRSVATNNSCGYKGVYFHKGKQKWYAHITCNGKQKHIGAFSAPEDAARAYNQRALELFGEFSKLNGGV